ncbi:MAG: methyltransferase domain-containing protein [Huintestinicola sp.]|uniref:class I SAM-dependent methyltransferase n=1 Tax=Huintestinicola sp. TaxID=2981661 RepID=UPI003F0B5D8E
MTLDIYDDDTLEYSSLYGDLKRKKDDLDKLRFVTPARLPAERGGVVNIRELLAYDGEKFVNMAYMTIIGRVPSKSEAESLLALLSKDNSRNAKLERMKVMASSQGGKQRGIILTGYESINVDQLYKFTDREFIEKAYINILWRKPDAQGGKKFLSRLRSLEYSPAEILHMLRYSAEGEKCGVDIIGLDRDYKKRMRNKKLMRIPVIGRLFSCFVSIFRVNSRINALVNENYRLRDELYNERIALDDRINNVNGSLAKRIGNNDRKLAELTGKISKLLNQSEVINKKSQKIAESLAELDIFAHQIDDSTNDLLKAQENYDRILGEQAASIVQLAEDVQARTDSFENSLRQLDGYTHQIGDNVGDINKALSNYDSILSEFVDGDKKTIQLLLAEVFSLKARINSLEKGTQKNAGTASSQAESVQYSAPENSNVYNSIDYFDFENHFRGSREHIKSVQKIYIPYFKGKKNVLDLGCGRGEFTELLSENNVGVTGVDQYEPYVEYMKSLGLPVVLDDAIAYLSRQESTDGIFLGQVVEHITTDQIVTICNMAYEKLEDGCCLIMETQNPQTLAIFYGAFYIDPSHQKPVHPLTLKYLAEKAGFSKVDIIYLESSRYPLSIPKIKEDETEFGEFNESMQKVSELLFGCRDYAVVARK